MQQDNDFPQSALEQWLVGTMREGETRDARFTRFGKQIGVSMHCIRKYIYGQRRIPDETKIKIETVTEGKVSLEDMVWQGMVRG